MPQNTNQYGPGNPKKAKAPANGVGAYNGTQKNQKKSGDPFKDSFGMGGAASPMSMDFGMDTPAANPMGGMMGSPAANPMGDMGGMMGMNAAPQQMSSPSMGGGYNQQQQDRLAINGEQPSGFQGKLNPGVLEGPSTVGGGIAGMNSMRSAQPTGAAGNQAQGLPYTTDPSTGPNIRYWDDPQARVDPIVDPDRGFISTPTGSGLAGTDTMDYSGMGGGWQDPGFAAFGGQMQQQPEVFPGNPILGPQGAAAAGPGGGQKPPQGDAPDGWQGEFDENPIAANWQDHQDQYNQYVANEIRPGWNSQWRNYQNQVSILDDLVDKTNKKTDKDAKKKPSRSSFARGQAPAGGDALYGGPQSGFTEAQVVDPLPYLHHLVLSRLYVMMEVSSFPTMSVLLAQSLVKPLLLNLR